MSALVIAIVAGIALAFGLPRLFSGPTLHDRALAARTLLIRVSLVCAAVAVAMGRSAWLDAAFAIVFAALVLMIAVMKVFRVRSFQAPLARAQEEA